MQSLNSELIELDMLGHLTCSKYCVTPPHSVKIWVCITAMVFCCCISFLFRLLLPHISDRSFFIYICLDLVMSVSFMSEGHTVIDWCFSSFQMISFCVIILLAILLYLLITYQYNYVLFYSFYLIFYFILFYFSFCV